ncbi:MAG: UDP-N-acetylmuramoyl-L-alanyl-D-glutamate--2,6-diaminopimelate ligase [Candidatus Cloacimonetes bacterium]|nr:UDP-N-acetylmuramoyl-L-alanyl-D-glutamate--2,6-diaminopimelate ligase [Candidatus Cloacimonadota bacterium]
MMQEYLLLLRKHNLLIISHTGLQDLPQPRTDHRTIQPGDAFIAIKGENFDGHKLIPEALTKGASLIIGESADCQIQVTDSRKAAAIYAHEYYGRATSKFTLYGVTGTNGKTTVSYLLFQILRKMGYSCGLIGTLGYWINEKHHKTNHTTPDILELHQIYHEMSSAGVQHVIMEVSSHALALDRVYNIDFDFCLFTNLSRDHLDFHRDMDEYFATKYVLFECAILNSANSVVNIDDDHGRLIAERLSASNANLVTVGHSAAADFQISETQTRLDGSKITCTINQTEVLELHSPLIGSFNVDNLALAVATLVMKGMAPGDISAVVPHLLSVPGRIDSVPNDLGIGIYVDYAHTPDAIINLLKSIDKLPHQHIFTVIGAGGNRDTGKRPLMLQAALRHSNAVIVTDDNPRYENPDQIVLDIVQDRDMALPWWIIRDRRMAINAALRIAQPGDIVLICGKGHENYQEIEGQRFDFDDRLVAKQSVETINNDKEEDELLLALDPLMLYILAEKINQGILPTSSGSYSHICTDSRKIKAHSVFFAIKGENFDGNQFIPDILDDPSCFAIGSRTDITNPRYLCVNDPVSLMAAVLRKYLQMFDPYKIALTGSTGKTSTKELIASVLEQNAPTLRTLKNENNIIGLCQTIIRILPQHRYAVFEIGTNHFGEIALLSDTIRPDAGIILNVGPSHLQYFGDEEGVFREKTELFNRPLDLCLYPADDPRFEQYRSSGTSVGYDSKAGYRISRVQPEDSSQTFFLNDEQYVLPYAAPHYVLNSSFTIAVAKHIGIPVDQIQMALQKPVAMDMRMQIEQVSGRQLIVDCYNANPVSMQAALEFWAGYHPELPHLAFLGDMLELGDKAEMYHRMIAAILAEISHDEVYTVGNHSLAYNNQPCRHYAIVEGLLSDFPTLPDQAVILVKASHGIHLEKLLPKLRGEY